jgi:CRP-like cAMP-binding protein
VNANELKRFGLLAEFTEADCLEVLQVLESSSLMAGRRLFREGGQSDGMALLVEGTVRLESQRTEQRVLVGSGTALGALSLVEMGPRESTAVTETPCEIQWLRRSDFRRLVDDSPRTACRLLEAIAGELAGRVRRELDNIAR